MGARRWRGLAGAGLLLVLAAGAGCSIGELATTTSRAVGADAGGPPATPPCCCEPDDTVACPGTAMGVTCPRGATPANQGYLSCSRPQPAGDGDAYCCIEAYDDAVCWSDLLVPGCAYPSIGFTCSGDDPATVLDPNLVCKAGPPDPATGYTGYCCQESGVPAGTGGCAADSTIVCDTGTQGVDCPPGQSPESELPGYVCGAPSPQPDGTDGYCCATGYAGSTCADDWSVRGCDFPSVGFSCAGTDTPEQGDPSLTCSAGVTDPNSGDTLYCCQ